MRKKIETPDFYVYILRRPDKIWKDGLFKPFYVGKGYKKRIDMHKYCYGTNTYKNNIIKKIQKSGMEIICEKVHENLMEEEAFVKEIELISFYGRINNGTGILCNMTDGGEGGAGFVFTDEQRKRLSQACMGRVISEEAKIKIGLKSLGNKNSLGLKASDETKEILSDIGRSRYLKDLEKLNLSLDVVGVRHVKENKSLNPIHKKEVVHKTDRRMPEEEKQHLSDIWKGVPKTAEHGKNISEGKTKIQVEIDGVNYSLRELAKIHNMDYSKLSYRYRIGLRGKDIITEGRVQRDLSEYLGRTEHGAFVSKVLIKEQV